jgi:hypothetical protein
MRVKILILFIVVISVACKKNPKPDLKPAAAVLTFPANNETCITGSILSATESSILFKWKQAVNVESYKLSIKNLEKGTTAFYNSSSTELEVKLIRNTPYSWHIISNSSKVADTAKSEVWKFYNAGEANASYAPFPAEIILPTMGQNVSAVNSKIILDWNGSDVDNDIASYDVYLGTTKTPALLSANLTSSILNDIIVTSNTLYYWKVVSKDSKGNTSDSGLYQFKVN